MTSRIVAEDCQSISQLSRIVLENKQSNCFSINLLRSRSKHTETSSQMFRKRKEEAVNKPTMLQEVLTLYLTKRLHVAVRLFSNRSLIIKSKIAATFIHFGQTLRNSALKSRKKIFKPTSLTSKENMLSSFVCNRNRALCELRMTLR